MYSHIFVDVNVWVDLFDVRRPFHEASKKCIRYLLQQESALLYTSCDIITTVYYLLSKKGAEVALGAIEYVNAFCTVIEFGNTEIAQSTRIMRSNADFTDLEDTIQYVMAQKVHADLILSNDSGFVSEGIEVMGTEEFCEKMGI